jgi:hypothetical protein
MLQLQVSAGPPAGSCLSLDLTAEFVVTGWADGSLRGHHRAPPPTPLINAMTGMYSGAHALSPNHTHHSPHRTQVGRACRAWI